MFWYNAGLPENIPDLYFGPNKVSPIDSFILHFNCLNMGDQGQSVIDASTYPEDVDLDKMFGI